VFISASRSSATSICPLSSVSKAAKAERSSAGAESCASGVASVERYCGRESVVVAEEEKKAFTEEGEESRPGERYC
jgi:hypothetical protein